MNKELRLIIRSNNDHDGITEAIINKFRDYYDNVSGVVLDCNLKPRERDYSFKYISAESFSSHYNEFVNKAKKPIDGSVLKAMLPYKSMAIHIMMRSLHYDIFDRSYLEDVYYSHLKYWNELLDLERINYAIFMVIPHHVGEYILYSLCKIKGIKTTLLYPQLSYNGVSFFMGDSIETIGQDIKTSYENLCKGDCNDYDDLSDFMKGVIANTNSNKVVGSQQQKEIAQMAKNQMYRTISLPLIIKYGLWNILNQIKNIDYTYKEYTNNTFKYLVKARIHEKRMDHLADYRKLCEMPRKGEKYIYFPLQMTPEASTMPLAGEFKNQLLSLDLLADAAKEYNIYIYVKEHWVQYNRERGFYKKIAQKNNVRLIDMTCNSLDLIEGSVAVASQTGSCLFEALVKNKPAFSLGEGCVFKGAPNIINVMDEIDIVKNIKSLLNNSLVLNNDDLIKYFKAINDNLLFGYIDSLNEAVSFYSKEQTANRIVLFSLSNNAVDVLGK